MRAPKLSGKPSRASTPAVEVEWVLWYAQPRLLGTGLDSTQVRTGHQRLEKLELPHAEGFSFPSIVGEGVFGGSVILRSKEADNALVVDLSCTWVLDGEAGSAGAFGRAKTVVIRPGTTTPFLISASNTLDPPSSVVLEGTIANNL